MFEAGADTCRQPGGLRSGMERYPLAARDHAVGRNHAGEMAVLTGQVCALNETLAAQVFERLGSTHRFHASGGLRSPQRNPWQLRRSRVSTPAHPGEMNCPRRETRSRSHRVIVVSTESSLNRPPRLMTAAESLTAESLATERRQQVLRLPAFS